MDKLLMIADDLTGALDAAVVFAREGIRVCVGQEDYFLTSPEAKSCPVQVTVVESRHIKPEDAYTQVHRIVTLAREENFTHIYKKTDSALRGNVGAELAAVRSAAGEDTLWFIPAYPKMGRITKGDIHYIDSVIPVAESVFAADPFNPVRHSRVAEVIRQTAAVHTYTAGVDSHSQPGIACFDAATDSDIFEIASALLKGGKARLLAGCAGFANVLPRLLALPRQKTQPDIPRGNLAVFCGSINPISLEQCSRAVALGAPHVTLKEENRWRQPEEVAAQMAPFVGCSPITVFDTGSAQVDAREPDAAEAGARVARMVSRVIRLVLQQSDAIPMIIGGDTLIAFIRELGIDLIFPMAELFPGTVLSKYLYNGSWHFLISKSGGFGNPDLLQDIVALLNQTTQKTRGCI